MRAYVAFVQPTDQPTDRNSISSRRARARALLPQNNYCFSGKAECISPLLYDYGAHAHVYTLGRWSRLFARKTERDTPSRLSEASTFKGHAF